MVMMLSIDISENIVSADVGYIQQTLGDIGNNTYLLMKISERIGGQIYKDIFYMYLKENNVDNLLSQRNDIITHIGQRKSDNKKVVYNREQKDLCIQQWRDAGKTEEEKNILESVYIILHDHAVSLQERVQYKLLGTIIKQKDENVIASHISHLKEIYHNDDIDMSLIIGTPTYLKKSKK